MSRTRARGRARVNTGHMGPYRTGRARLAHRGVGDDSAAQRVDRGPGRLRDGRCARCVGDLVQQVDELLDGPDEVAGRKVGLTSTRLQRRPRAQACAAQAKPEVGLAQEGQLCSCSTAVEVTPRCGPSSARTSRTRPRRQPRADPHHPAGVTRTSARTRRRRARRAPGRPTGPAGAHSAASRSSSVYRLASRLPSAVTASPRGSRADSSSAQTRSNVRAMTCVGPPPGASQRLGLPLQPELRSACLAWSSRSGQPWQGCCRSRRRSARDLLVLAAARCRVAPAALAPGHGRRACCEGRGEVAAVLARDAALNQFGIRIRSMARAPGPGNRPPTAASHAGWRSGRAGSGGPSVSWPGSRTTASPPAGRRVPG